MTTVQQFLADNRLTELIELCKTSDSLLSLFNLIENQHSTMLAWCLNPSEGHGLGDSILKDLLLAATISGAANESVTGVSQSFLTQWTPGRIRNTSFGSAFITRELGIETQGETGARRGRLDLFVVDPINKLLIVVENKTGSALTAEQLLRYEEAVKQELKPLSMFKDYDCLLLVLDQWLDTMPSTNWIGVDYSFLEATATRARLLSERGNPAARLVLEYCEQHSDRKSTDANRIDELATALALTYPTAIDSLKTAQRLSVKEWAKSRKGGDESELALFCKQAPDVVQHLIDQSGVSAIVHRVLAVSNQHTSDDFYEIGRTYANFGPKALEEFRREEDDYWPVYLNVYRHNVLSSPGNDKFVVRLGFNGSVLHSRFDAMEVVDALANRNLRVRGGKTDSLILTTLRKDMSATQAIEFLSSALQELDKALTALARSVSARKNPHETSNR